MKVAVFTRFPADPDHPRGGIEAVAVVLVEALALLKDLDVHVITLERAQKVLRRETVGGATIHRLPGSRCVQIVDILAGPGKRRLTRYVEELGVDVLHTHETFGLGLIAPRVPHVFTVHGFDHANLRANQSPYAWIRAPLWRRVERFGLKRQKHIISISPYVRAMLEPLTNAVMYDIDNPVDARFFEVNRRTEPGRVLCVGWVNHRKNTFGAVQAVAQVARSCSHVRLAIAGESNEPAYLEQIEAYIHKHNLEPNIEFLGRLAHRELLSELGRAAAFLLPSRQENAPMAISEAMAAGVPVIASDRCGMPFMVSEGESGYLVDPEDTEQIADRLERILVDRALANRMASCGRQIAMDRFAPEQVAARTRDVYRALCT